MKKISLYWIIEWPLLMPASVDPFMHTCFFICKTNSLALARMLLDISSNKCFLNLKTYNDNFLWHVMDVHCMLLLV